MKRYQVYQTVYLGTVDVPEGTKDVIEYMEENDCWPNENDVINIEVLEDGVE